MLIRIVNPKGMAPSLNPAVLAENMAQRAVNCLLGKGAVTPLRGTTVVGAPSKGGTVKTIFPFGGKWFNWISPVSVCLSPIAQDPWGRVYFAGGGAFPPQMTAAGIATSGSDYPSVSYLLGVPAPVSAPSVSVTGTPTSSDPTLVESRAYVETYVSAYGEEGPPCAPSTLVNVAPGQNVAVAQMGTGPVGAYNITHKRLYRTNTGSSGTDYQLVRPGAYPDGLIPIAVTDVLDDCPSDALGSVLASADWDGPPDDLHSLILLPCGALAGLSGNELCFSEPYLPHAWPVKYRFSFDADGVALGAYGNNVLATTKGGAYVTAGSSPASMSPPERLEEGYPCVSGRGMVDMGYSVIYPAADGLMLAGMGEVRLLTRGLIDPKDWAALAPETIHAYRWDGKYVAFWENGTGTAGFIFDPATGDLSYHTVEATAGYHDTLTGTLTLAGDGDLFTWNTGDALTAVWKSKRFVLPYRHNLSCAKVKADGYPVTLKLYADGALKMTKSVAGPDPFRLPSKFRPERYEVEISGDEAVTAVALASSNEELAGA